MPTIKLSDSMPAPVQEVFSRVADVSGSGSYNKDVLNATQLTEGSVGKGTRFAIEMKGMGKVEVEVEVEVTEYSEPDRIVFLGTSPRFSASHEYRFTSEGDGTRMDQVVDMRMKGFAKIFAPFVGPMAKKGIGKAAAELRRQFEG